MPSIPTTPDFWSGFYAGVFASIIAFALAVFWDIWKSWRADEKRDKAVITGIQHQLEDNIRIAAENAQTLNEEIGALKDGQIVAHSLAPFDMSMRALVAVGIPSCFTRDAEAFDKFRKIVFSTNQLNEDFRSRQAYKDGYQHPKGDPYYLLRRLGQLDPSLLNRINELQAVMADLRNRIR